jgi:hypothetical protein
VVVEGIASGNLNDYNSVMEFSTGIQAYITAAWDENDVYSGVVPTTLTVGDGKEYPARGVRYINVPLMTGTEYTIFTRYDIASDVGTEVNQE